MRATTFLAGVLLLSGCAVPGPDASAAMDAAPSPIVSSPTSLLISPTSTGPVTPDIPKEIHASPPASDCDTQRAKAFHRDINEQVQFSRGTMTLRGFENGERTDLTLSFDLPNDLLYIRDGIEGSEVVSRGRLVASLGDEGALWRQDGGLTFVDSIMADTSWTDEPVASDTAPFAIPTSWFRAACLEFRGSLVPSLHYSEYGLFEAWLFEPSSGDVLQAIHKNNLTETDLVATFANTVQVPIIPPDLPRIAISLVWNEVSADFIGTSDRYLFREVVADGSERALYSDLMIVLYDDADNEIETLSLAAGRKEGTHGTIEVIDSGERGVTDAGDELRVTLSPTAASWDIWDSWASDWAEMTWLGEDEVPDVVTPPEPFEVEGTATITRVFEWSYLGEEWTWEVSIPQALYDHYVDTPFVYAGGAHAYDVYVSTPYDDEWIQALADALAETSREHAWGDDEVLSFALAFVQSLPYTSDDVTTGFDEYARYPVETLVDGGGDCEDTSILYASLVLALGYDAVMLSPPGHMAVGVAAEENVPGSGYTYNGRRYLFAETTGEGYAIGEIPEEYENARADVISLEPKAIIDVTWSLGNEHISGYQQAVLQAANVGTAAASEAELWVGLLVAGDEVYSSDSCRFETLEPDETAECTVWLHLPSSGTRTKAQFIVAARPNVYETAESDAWVV